MTKLPDTPESQRQPTPSAVAPCSAWIESSKRMPNDAEWYLVVIEGEEVTRRVGLGWRKWHSDGNPNGWWETNFGLTRQEYITHWMPRPALPPKRKRTNRGAQAAPLGFRWVRCGEWLRSTDSYRVKNELTGEVSWKRHDDPFQWKPRKCTTSRNYIRSAKQNVKDEPRPLKP